MGDLLDRTLSDGQKELLARLRESCPRLARLVAGDAIADVEHTQAALVELGELLEWAAAEGAGLDVSDHTWTCPKHGPQHAPNCMQCLEEASGAG